MGVDVSEVIDKEDLKDFIQFPYDLYRDHPVWVPPLRFTAKREFDRKKNGFFKGCDAALFIARRNGIVKGRIAAFVNHAYIKFWKEPLGFFGSFESINDREVSRALFGAAADWLFARKMKLMRGPLNFTSQSVGFLVAGFDRPHTVLSPYNFPYYDLLAKDAGLEKNMDINGYWGDCRDRYVFPERFVRHYETLIDRHRVHVRPIDQKKIPQEVRTILSVANASNRGEWNYIPVDESEVDSIVSDFSNIADPECVFIMEKGTKAVGYAVALPDINVIIKGLNGSLFPFGFLKIKLGAKQLREYRLLGLGLIPDFQNKALDTLLYYHIYRALSKKNACLDASWVREDNHKMNRALVKLRLKLVKKFRVYQKQIEPAQ
jgi:hypothetical protein